MKKYTRKQFRRFTFYGYKNFLRSMRHRKKKVVKEKAFTRRVIIELPKKLNIRIPKYRDKIIQVIQEARKNLILGKDVVLSFKNVVAPIMPDAMILIISERKRLLQEFEERRIYCQKHKNNKFDACDVVNQLLEKFNLISQSKQKSKQKEHYLVKDWKYEEGKDDTYSESQKSLVDSIISKFKNSLYYPPIQVGNFTNSQPFSKRLYINLTEATGNVTSHAYIRTRFQDEKPLEEEDVRWWMFKSESVDGEAKGRKGMTAIVCDRGIGIPRSLNIKLDEAPSFFNRVFLEKIKVFLELKDDARLIEAAIDHGRSRTKLDERGKGLYQIVETIEKTPGAMLMIYSGKGFFSINVDQQKNITRNYQVYQNSIMGTIICWYLPLKGDNPNE